jgi:urea transport system substrate-binding protein
MTDYKQKILVVDDDEDIRFAVKTLLELNDYEVTTAQNGQEALDIITQNPTKHDLIILDMKMPIMDGWQFASAFTEKFDHTTPIVVLTAAADAKKRAQDINAAGWIDKPFSMTEFLAVVKECIRAHVPN